MKHTITVEPDPHWGYRLMDECGGMKSRFGPRMVRGDLPFELIGKEWKGYNKEELTRVGKLVETYLNTQTKKRKSRKRR